MKTTLFLCVAVITAMSSTLSAQQRLPIPGPAEEFERNYAFESYRQHEPIHPSSIPPSQFPWSEDTGQRTWGQCSQGNNYWWKEIQTHHGPGFMSVGGDSEWVKERITTKWIVDDDYQPPREFSQSYGDTRRNNLWGSSNATDSRRHSIFETERTRQGYDNFDQRSQTQERPFQPRSVLEDRRDYLTPKTRLAPIQRRPSQSYFKEQQRQPVNSHWHDVNPRG